MFVSWKEFKEEKLSQFNAIQIIQNYFTAALNPAILSRGNGNPVSLMKSIGFDFM